MDTPTRKRIVILGAGFAGLYAALELDRSIARDPDVDVVLISSQNFLLFTPMLHEVAAGSLDPSSIVVPIRQVLRRVRLIQAEATGVDFERRTVTACYGLEQRVCTIGFDHLLIAAGSQTRFPPGLRQHAHGMKSIHDALVLRNWLIELLERAELEDDPAVRRALLTIVVSGGGFSGVETIGAINDFLRDVARHYPRACVERPALVLVEANRQLLPDFEPTLGKYTESKLAAAGVDVRLGTKVMSYDGRVLALTGPGEVGAPSSLATRTLVWTAGVAPSPLIESLPLPKERGRIVVDGGMAVPGYVGVWACGDCAAVPDADGKPYPPTAQHAVQQGRRVGANIAAAIQGDATKIAPLRYRTIGQAAAIGRQRAVATLFGLRFSGFGAWLFWRSSYLLMLPRLDRKLRVLLQWLLEICFARDTVQLLTVQSVRSRRLEELLDGAQATEVIGK
ncbi:MAG: NAD(P)/FAD-dependent oxidoreductase [Pseudomonadota bacterium]|nr:NAD(P)/FAD-dependent oxidoreductase [Pseudomonadota bacterium]